MQLTVAHVGVLRQGWADAVTTLAPEMSDLPEFLESRLDEAVLSDALDEESLLGIVDEGAGLARATLAPAAANALARRLQRAVYEYLLSLDAAAPEEEPAPVVQVVALPAGPPVIGVDEVAELSGRQAPAGPATTEHEETVADAPADAPGEAEEEETPTADSTDSEGAAASRPGRFMVFRRNGSPTPEAEADTPPPAAPPEPPPFVPPGPVPVPVSTFPAPRDGFHLTDHADFEAPPAPAVGDMAPTPGIEPLPGLMMPQRERPRGPSSRGWRVRSLRATRQEDAGPPVDGDEDDDEQSPAENAFHNDPKAIEIRRQINDRLRKRRCDDAASMMQKLAADFGGRPVADLGLDAGDRCRALGKTNAALSCYLAASRADPVYDEPLLRLADICIDDRDIDLAVSYLERVARLHRLRADVKGALRVYRKIATIAPNREDILSVLMRAQATGRFDD